MGRSIFYVLDYKPMLEKTGFQNIVELKYAIPTNAWAPGKQSQKIGTLQRTNVLQVLDVYSLAIFTQGLGWSKEAIEKLLAETRKDIENTRIHSYTTLMTVYCQKPQSSSASSFDTAYQPTRTTTWQQRPSVS
ncbi:uncharacterized protein F4822DRAFT_298117 [Hypoxylon trugodes]|uniref:uncharacterized protein n=1 Tax=Hypoxylon trugodes TaxID=326681 RepID=UPI00219FF2C9|nr:uncharacterized protein F4822DRAFT_298117 [Hypoxylon trugodes]KAI1387973.1 hypothetical protein F4822DRAFT_298117 [Hypoxylon trugodes]